MALRLYSMMSFSSQGFAQGFARGFARARLLATAPG